MVTAPIRTITMAITIANTGRSMKNFAMLNVPALLPCSVRAVIGLRIDERAWADSLETFDDYFVAGLQALLHDPIFADTLGCDHVARYGLIFVAAGKDGLQALQVRY